MTDLCPFIRPYAVGILFILRILVQYTPCLRTACIIATRFSGLTELWMLFELERM